MKIAEAPARGSRGPARRDGVAAPFWFSTFHITRSSFMRLVGVCVRALMTCQSRFFATCSRAYAPLDRLDLGAPWPTTQVPEHVCGYGTWVRFRSACVSE
jgi:hypothetical protein